MGTIWVRQFVGGLDGRRLPETTSGGSLIRARDGHINRGGEVEQRAKFVKVYDLPGGTIGLAADSEGIIVFGSGAEPGGMPAGVTYQRLQHPDGAIAIDNVLSTDLFADKVYAAARFGNDGRYNFYDGSRVPDANWPPDLVFGSFVKTIRKQAYALSGSYLLRSGILSTDPEDGGDFNFVFDSGTNPAALAINMSSETAGAEKLQSLARYGDFVAVFAERTIQVWVFDPDPDLSRQVQTLANTGTISPKSVTQFGDADVFYLDANGVRSLKARSTTDAAFSSDIGNPIDDIIIDDLAVLTDTERRAAIGLIEPLSGRYWLILKNKIYVFSYFAGSKVSAWSDYIPGFNVDDAIVFNDHVYLRSGREIYVYGGLGDTPVWEDVETEVWLPYLDADKPTQPKQWKGVDAACAGTWEVRVGQDPANLSASDKVGTITGTTYNLQRIEGIGKSTHASMRFTLVAPPASGPAKLAAVVLHHDLKDPEG